MKKKKSNNIDIKFLIVGLLLFLIALIIPYFSIIRILFTLIGIALITCSLVKDNKKLKKRPRLIIIIVFLLLISSLFIDTIVVATFKRIPIYTLDVISSNNAKVYNGIGYRIWQCDKKVYKNLKVDPFNTHGYLCDAKDIEEIDSNSFLSSVVTNYNEYNNQYVKIRGKISQKNAQNYLEMQPYELGTITLNGYVNFADNITLKIMFNEQESLLDRYDVYDEIVVVGIIKNLEIEDEKYTVYMHDSKVVSDMNYDNYEFSITKEYECTDQSILYSSDLNDVYTYCINSFIIKFEDKKYELSSALSSNKFGIEELIKKAITKENDDYGNTMYRMKDFSIYKCNPNNSKDVIIGPVDLSPNNLTCNNISEELQ